MALERPVVVLAGGTGGARLARGMLDVVGPERLVVIANPADDIEIHGVPVSPDPDLITFGLADRLDDRGWGLRGDTFAVMDGLRELGQEVWFNLGDRDLAWCLERGRLLSAGHRPTEALAILAARLGVRAAVLPACDEPIRTRVRAGGEELDIQRFLIQRGGRGPVQDVRFPGAPEARPTAEVLAALAGATAIVVGPSNPVISIAPMLAIPGLRAAIATADAPVVAVSPVVGGRILKGPTAACLQWAGQPVSAAGVAAFYDGLLDGMVADEPAGGLPVRQTTVAMPDAQARRRLAAETLSFAEALASGR